MPNCFRVRCGWYIIHKGWLRNCPFGNAIDSTYIRQYKLFCYTVKQWCYTFMYPRYCENENELVISKCLLLAYIHSRVGDIEVPALGLHSFTAGSKVPSRQLTLEGAKLFDWVCFLFTIDNLCTITDKFFVIMKSALTAVTKVQTVVSKSTQLQFYQVEQSKAMQRC